LWEEEEEEKMIILPQPDFCMIFELIGG